MAVKVIPPLTAAGEVQTAPLVPSPTCPFSIKPQQNAVPPVARPHVCSQHATSAVNVRPQMLIDANNCHWRSTVSGCAVAKLASVVPSPAPHSVCSGFHPAGVRIASHEG